MNLVVLLAKEFCVKDSVVLLVRELCEQIKVESDSDFNVSEDFRLLTLLLLIMLDEVLIKDSDI